MKGKRRREYVSDEDEDEPNKRLQKASQPNSNLRAGRILRMTLKNFMCHSFLEVVFAGNVNFLTGNNGSGKSAILAALSLGLGCKAKTTNRGDISSVKAFIKFGCNSASIEIVLNNMGPQAYKPDEYGEKIIVCRTMTLGGGSTYRIKNEQGRVVSRKNKDLQELTSSLNIQVDNPVCILSQDTARNFLNATDKKKRFDLFYRATRLDHLNEMFLDAVRHKNMAMKEFNIKKQQENELLKRSNKIQKKIDQARKLEELKEKMQELEREKAWGNTIINENKYKKQQAIVERMVKTLGDMQEGFDIQQKKVENLEKVKRELEMRLAELQQCQETTDKPAQELSLKMRAVEKEIMEKRNNIQKTERQMTFRKQDLDGIKKLIDNYHTRCSQIEDKKKTKEENLGKLNQQRQEKINLLATYEDEFNKLSTHCKEKEGRMDAIKQQLHASTNKINVLNDKLNTLQRETHNPYAIYGPNMVRLMNAIEADEQNFTRPPIGPLGAHVSVKDRRWTLAVESYLKAGLLHSFLVNSQQDQNRLSQIVKRIWPREGGGRPPAIIATKFVDRLYDVSKFLVASHPQCVRMLDVLSVPNPVVMNCLIDQAKIESVLLIPDKKFGFGILKNRASVPTNCRIAVTPTGDSIHPDPNYKFYSGRQTSTKFLQVDSADAVRQCEAALAKENQTRSELKTTFQSAREEISSAGESLPRLRQHVSKCRQDLEAIALQIDRLQTQAVDLPGNVDDLQKELAELEKIIKEKAGAVQEATLEVEELQARARELKAELRERDASQREARKTREDIQDQIDSHRYKSQAVVNEFNTLKKRLEEYNTSMTNETGVMKDLQLNWERLCSETERANGERPEVVRRSDEIDEDVNRLRIQMQDLTRLNLNGLQDELGRLQERIDVHRETMEDIEHTLVELQHAKAGRKEKLLQTKKYMKEFAIFNFKNFLQCRNYQGNMAINYDDETLDMIVIPHAGARGVTPTTNLSGGERSFSTVAFLYALWKTLDFPFYILDEFDVYMDPQNRSLVIQILIDHAKKNKEVQYVFLTPQDISFIVDPDVAIHRLEDPERIRAQ